jgi:hypothetical protein
VFHKSPITRVRMSGHKDCEPIMPPKTQSAPNKRAKNEKSFFGFLASWRENKVLWSVGMTDKAASHEIKSLVDDCIGRKLDGSELKMRGSGPGCQELINGSINFLGFFRERKMPGIFKLQVVRAGDGLMNLQFILWR